jgi:type II secretory ATPase GspE/PulE/Tfp pilus assembly ATPase PilB-like protein/nucleotide-binding universal stress UspA family protein
MIQTILFPTDYSEASHLALRYAGSLARQSRAKLVVVYVEPPSLPPLGGEAGAAIDLDRDQANLLKLLAEVTEGEDAPIAHEFLTLRGDPATEIVQLGRKLPADLIVMATTGRTGWRRLLIGSVAEAVIREAACPVLTLKHSAVGAELSAAVFEPLAAPPEFSAGPAADHSNATELIRRAVAARATDVHFDPSGSEIEVRFRIDGRLERYCRLSAEVGHALIAQLKILAELDIADPFRPQEGRLALAEPARGVEIRITKVPVVGGESVSLRLLDQSQVLRPLDSLGVSSEPLSWLHAMLRLGEGLVLITGPSGSGKTTTAYSMVYTLDDGTRNIVTMEDPAELHIPGFRQMSVDPRHGVTMNSGLRSLLRMDPDIVLIGEIRDAETAGIGMRAASSGKYVFTTLHTRDVASTITALRDLQADNRSLAGNLTGIISQRLVRRLCPQCRRSMNISKEQRQLFHEAGLEPPDQLFHSVGCAACHHRGYQGRIGVFEVALMNPPLRGSIEAGGSEAEFRDLLRTHGTCSLLAEGLKKAAEGITSLDEVRAMTWISFAEQTARP